MSRLTASVPANLSHRQVLRLALPIMLANAAIPLLGMVDTAVVGRFESALAIGAVAFGAMIFSIVFWLFGFLKMVTSGLAAQAFGQSSDGTGDGATIVLLRALVLGLGFGLLILLVQWPLGRLSFFLLALEPELDSLTQTYFSIRIWAAPATLMTFAALGWLIGMQRTGAVLILQLLLNGINIALDFLFVGGFGWGVAGVAAASLIAEYVTVGVSLWLVWRGWPHRRVPLPVILDRAALTQLMSQNSHVALRTLSLEAAFLTMTRLSATFGATVLAANAILMHLYILNGYLLDGFAHAAEALTGEAIGRRNRSAYDRAFRLTQLWSVIGGAGFTLVYAALGGWFITLFTVEADVIASANTYLIWSILLPVLSVFTMHFDGVFIGATRTREMRDAMILSLVVYVAAVAVLVPLWGNHGLWAAFIVFTLARAVFLWRLMPRIYQLFD